MGQNFMFYRILVRYFVHVRRVFHGFAAQILYSPFKLKVNTTYNAMGIDKMALYSPFKLKVNTTGSKPLSRAYRLYSPFKLKVNTTDKSDRSDPVLIITPFQFKGQYNFNISEEHFSYYTPSPPPVHIKISPSLQHTFS